MYIKKSTQVYFWLFYFKTAPVMDLLTEPWPSYLYWFYLALSMENISFSINKYFILFYFLQMVPFSHPHAQRTHQSSSRRRGQTRRWSHHLVSLHLSSHTDAWLAQGLCSSEYLNDTDGKCPTFCYLFVLTWSFKKSLVLFTFSFIHI